MFKVLNINFRSLNNPQTRDGLHTLLDHTNPAIVIESETWLNSDINNAEIFPDEMGFEMFRRDRSSRGGGVLILVSKIYIAHRVDQFETECKILWFKIEIKGCEPLHIAAFYRPHESDSASLDQLQISMERVSQVKGHVWLLGEFNLPKCSWEDNIPTLKQDLSISAYTMTLQTCWRIIT